MSYSTRIALVLLLLGTATLLEPNMFLVSSVTILLFRPDVWVHGHVHHSVGYVLGGGEGA